MYNETMPSIGTSDAWRTAARRYLAANIPPEQILWSGESSTPDMFTRDMPNLIGVDLKVPRSFLSMAQTVVWHSDPERFAKLYAFLWRLRSSPALMGDRGDKSLAHLRRMEKGVRRCQHKMKAFVRFRELGNPTDRRRSFAAWFEPTHHTVEPTASFFAKRFGDMDWSIYTPDVSASFQSGKLSFDAGREKPVMPDDASEDLWITYFQNIFNPARLKVQAMQSEMPKKYWKNLPEAAAIPAMIAQAPQAEAEMAKKAPTLPPERMEKVQAQLLEHSSAWNGPHEELPRAIAGCTRCTLHEMATQAVLGCGPTDADLMIVGEQPGDQEDLTGTPFVGPAGQLFHSAAKAAGLDCSQTYLTNAVKHFKFKPVGRRRIHQRPSTTEVVLCRFWLTSEITQVQPRLILAMGATAAKSLTGDGTNIQRRRGTVETSLEGCPVLITYHPSFLLRCPDMETKLQATADFERDLRTAARTANLRPLAVQ